MLPPADIHAPLTTVEEALRLSAWLRLPPSVPPEERQQLVNSVMRLVELTRLRDRMVGVPGGC